MNPLPIGSLISGDCKDRDAIHVAVIPVEANSRLDPGDHVGIKFSAGGYSTTRRAPFVGIVDPFLPKAIFPGDRFFLFLYPNTVQSLRHYWTHPAFEETPTADAEHPDSKKFLVEFAASQGISYERLIEVTEAYLNEGSYSDLSYSISLPTQFWGHYEKVSGREIPAEDRIDYFSCSC